MYLPSSAFALMGGKRRDRFLARTLLNLRLWHTDVLIVVRSGGAMLDSPPPHPEACCDGREGRTASRPLTLSRFCTLKGDNDSDNVAVVVLLRAF